MVILQMIAVLSWNINRLMTSLMRFDCSSVICFKASNSNQFMAEEAFTYRSRYPILVFMTVSRASNFEAVDALLVTRINFKYKDIGD